MYNGLFGISPYSNRLNPEVKDGKTIKTTRLAEDAKTQAESKLTQNPKFAELKEKMDKLADEQIKKDNKKLEEIRDQQIKGLYVEKED